MLSRGYPKEDIKKALLNYSYTEKEINEAFSEMNTNGHRSALKYILLVLVVIMIISTAIVYLPGLFSSERDGGPYQKIELTAKGEEKLSKAINVCEMMSNANYTEKCVMVVEAAIKKDPADCEKYEGVNKDYCYAYTAKGRGDESICSKVEDRYLKNTCILVIALANKDVSLCNKLDEEVTTRDIFGKGSVRAREGCIKAIAKKKEDMSLCNMLPEKVTLEGHIFNRTVFPNDECEAQFAVIRNDINYCYLIDKSVRNSCLKNFAKATKNASVCEKIEPKESTDLGGRRDLDYDERNECFEELAKTNLDAELCFKLVEWNSWEKKLEPSSFNIYRCLEYVPGITEDHEFCERLDDIWDREMCYGAAAKGSGDAGICDNIQNRSDVSYRICIENAAKASGNESICNFIENKSSPDFVLCLIESKTKKAILNKNPSVCEGFGEDFEKEKTVEYAKSSCYSHYAIENKDYSLCEKVTVKEEWLEPWMFNCHIFWAMEKKEPSKCSVFKDFNETVYLDACYEQVANEIANVKEEIMFGLDEYM
jgi:hypothetical protein